MYCSSDGPNGAMVGLGDKPSNTVDSGKGEEVLYFLVVFLRIHR